MIALLLALAPLASAAPDCGSVDLSTLPAPCGTVAIGTAWQACGTGSLQDAGLHAPDPTLRDRVPWRSEGELAVRQGFEGTFQSHETEHFAIWWDEYTGFAQGDIELLGQDLEHSWDVEIEQLGWPRPVGTDTHKFNVYIGDSGPDAPSSRGAGGYYWYDEQGWPMIVIAASQVPLSTARTTAAHELLHASQAAADTYTYQGQAAWYHEATAVWVESEVYVDDPQTASFLYWFAIRPELAVDHFVYPTTGAPEEYHQYGAFLFVEYLDAFVGGPDLVLRSWLDATADDPMRTLDTLLPTYETTLDAAFFAFADRNATWDWPLEWMYEGVIAEYGGWNSQSHRPTVTTRGTTDGWVEPPAHLPRSYGANYWRLHDLPDEGLLSFAGDTGDEGPRAWHVSIAAQEGDEHRRAVLDLEDGAGAVDLERVGPHDEAWLVVAAADTTRANGATFDYAVRIDEPPPNPLSAGGGEGSCGCATGGSPGPWSLLLVPWLISLRSASGRRRSRSR